MEAEEFLRSRGWVMAMPAEFPPAAQDAYWKNPGLLGERYLRQELAIKFVLEKPPFEVLECGS